MIHIITILMVKENGEELIQGRSMAVFVKVVTKNLMQCDCVIFLKKNYDIDNSNIAGALSSRYREVGNKEFICKPCHTKLQHSHFSTLNLNGVDHSKNMVVMNSNDTTPSMAFHMTSPDFTQNPTYTNHCICTCCHKT